MRTGRYQESLETIDKAFELLDALKEEFKADVHVIHAKFSVNKSNTHFILRNWKESQAAA
jgi:DNA-binding IclR family transcriptional regulator